MTFEKLKSNGIYFPNYKRDTKGKADKGNTKANNKHLECAAKSIINAEIR